MDLPAALAKELKENGILALWNEKKKGFILSIAPWKLDTLSLKITPIFEKKRFLFWKYDKWLSDKVVTLGPVATLTRAMGLLSEAKDRLRGEGYPVSFIRRPN